MKTVYFSETNAASDLKIGGSRHLNLVMKVCEYSMSFLDHSPMSLTHDIKTSFLRNRWASFDQISLYVSFNVH